ncbi:uncharacterized protein VTP21DRAFT_3810 [Calcarisporiella thermophila]|uniref:uncharacterized protein n=1 Tax=Calcarisporiella thermophila TaxID=911321 RepID=UPI003742891C
MQNTTELTRWKLEVKHGAQVWHYADHHDQTACEKYHIGLHFEAKEFPVPKTAQEAAHNAFEFIKLLQTEDGHWAGEYGGPEFLIPGLVIAHYVCEAPIPEPDRLELARYLINTARPDGGWGIHTAGVATVFGTALNYCALRILGLEPDHPVMIKSRATLHKLGGATGAPSWGKLWLSVLGVYDWEGVNPIPPELWLFPQSVPFHPSRFWVHTRAVYLPMAYIYGRRFVGKETALVRALREELYTQPYNTIDWPAQRSNVAEIDLYVPHSTPMKLINAILGVYEKYAIPFLRKRALEKVYEFVRLEDEDTFYLCIGPVNKAMHMVIRYFVDGPESEAFKQHLVRNRDFLWLGPQGMMMNGTNGSQLWDTAFIIQAALEAGLVSDPKNHETVLRAYEFLDDTQIKRNPPHMHITSRHQSLGAWPFSTRDQGYTVSDCTAEGLKTVLYLNTFDFIQNKIPKERLCQAVDVLLSMQNQDGGFASYEKIRGPQYLELINAAEVFGNIMIEYSYTECTTASVLGLKTFSKFYPDYRAEEIRLCCEKALQFIKAKQNPDGSWYGSWAICFTYASWFALESLASMGEYYDNSEFSKRGCDFLIEKQQEDGGWGETYKACETGVYHQNETSQVVNTAWAILSLMAAKYPDETPIRRGIQLIMSRQLPDGSFKQECIEGVFNRNCMISYPNYKFAFTLWALGRYSRIYDNPVLVN